MKKMKRKLMMIHQIDNQDDHDKMNKMNRKLMIIQQKTITMTMR
jgi:hypothetical protein